MKNILQIIGIISVIILMIIGIVAVIGEVVGATIIFEWLLRIGISKKTFIILFWIVLAVFVFVNLISCRYAKE